MVSAQKDLHNVDWSRIPVPVDDGGARHLIGMVMPDVALAATNGTRISLANRPGRIVVFGYPRTGRPGEIGPVADWDMIPGARGCTPQTCAFRDLAADLKAAGAREIYGLSTQDAGYQQELANRLHLPFPILSDETLELTWALNLPTMQVAGMTLIRRLALVIKDGRIAKVFYPVFPPDRNAGDVLVYLQETRA